MIPIGRPEDSRPATNFPHASAVSIDDQGVAGNNNVTQNTFNNAICAFSVTKAIGDTVSPNTYLETAAVKCSF